ncbi:helix-turn-helix domain-containing protein [Paenibacillus sp. PL91]|uniref:helix-turn-helix domain-containing protein n=1 Tax=Paenibacillus sp. PL91 TaxID=2729538 RepID=UPI00145D252F|nr:helix-turn-helix domain-containing protein [Paenibacillus sp. PL91]MBC9199999.1 helix-turn-helix domain-containing protein [Paenibacillus sp. PL91]
MSTLEHGQLLSDVIFEIEQACKSTESPSWAGGNVPLAQHILLYVAKGDGSIRIDGQLNRIERDSLHVLILGSTVDLQLLSDSSTELYWIAFDWFRLTESSDTGRSYLRETSFPLQGKLRTSGKEFKRYFYLLTSDGQQLKQRNRLLGQQYLYELLEGLLRHAEPVANNEIEGRLRLTLEYMQRHYREEIRVNKLAELAQLHPSYYAQIFKRTMDKTPVSYLTHLRMNKAKEMLLMTDKPVNDIAADVGYEDEFYFSRRFKETSGYSPTIYTRKQGLNIISLSSPYTDHLYTLGLRPCAAQMHRFMPFVTKELTLPKHATDTWEISRQAFSDMKPDLIVCKDNVLSKARAHINDIAPIVPIPWVSKDIYTHLKEIAELVDKEQAAKQWMDNHERLAERVRKKARLLIGDATVAICVARKNDLRIYGTRNIGHIFYRSLQFAMPERISAAQAPHAIGTGFNWMSIKPDEMKEFESDYLFISCETEADHMRVMQLIRTNRNWMEHPAVKNNKLYFIDWEKWIVYAPHVIDQQLEEIERLLGTM